MNREKGMAYCGLACAACGQNDSCAGCRDEGCRDREWCKNQGDAVWKRDFPAAGNAGIFLAIVSCFKSSGTAFAAFAGKYGEERLIDCLETGERAGPSVPLSRRAGWGLRYAVRRGRNMAASSGK